MAPDNLNEDWRHQWDILNERYIQLHSRYLEKDRDISRANDNLREKEGLLIRTVEQLNNANEKNIRLEERFTALEAQLKQRNIEIAQGERRVAKKKSAAILQAILIDVLFLLSTLLASFGVNMITSTNPNPVGWFVIAVAVVTYIVAGIIAVVRTVEGSEQ
jgi:F0F1-type ATP synthase assembly protein I